MLVSVIQLIPTAAPAAAAAATAAAATALAGVKTDESSATDICQPYR